MLVGRLLPGPGEGLPRAVPVLREQAAEPAADTPRAGPQIRVIGRERLGGGQVAVHLPGPGLVRHGEALHEQRGGLERGEP